MNPFVLNTWNFTLNISMYGPAIGTKIFTIYANDTENNTNSYTSSFGIIDTTPPTPSNLSESMDPLELGSAEIITLNVTDLEGVQDVRLQIEGGNHSMSNTGGNEWQYHQWTPLHVGLYVYTIYMEDYSNNWDSTSGSINVQDTTAPIAPILTLSPIGDVLGNNITFRWLDGSDPSGISYYWLIISTVDDPTDVSAYLIDKNITNVGVNSQNYTLEIPLEPGNYYYFLCQVDGVGNKGLFPWGVHGSSGDPVVNNHHNCYICSCGREVHPLLY